ARPGRFATIARRQSGKRQKPRRLRRSAFGTTMPGQLDHSEEEELPATLPHEIVLDDGLEPTSPDGASWITPVVLFAGLLLTLILSRLGVRFFFLPIILPFGVGGGRLLRQLRPPTRRLLRFREGTLWLATEGAW